MIISQTKIIIGISGRNDFLENNFNLLKKSYNKNI